MYYIGPFKVSPFFKKKNEKLFRMKFVKEALISMYLYRPPHNTKPKTFTAAQPEAWITITMELSNTFVKSTKK